MIPRGTQKSRTVSHGVRTHHSSPSCGLPPGTWHLGGGEFWGSDNPADMQVTEVGGWTFAGVAGGSLHTHTCISGCVTNVGECLHTGTFVGVCTHIYMEVLCNTLCIHVGMCVGVYTH